MNTIQYVRGQQVSMQYNVVVVVVVVSSSVRPQFRQWLLEQVQSRRYDGLYMIDRDTFRIPWKHNSRRDLGDEDNRIFRVSIWRPNNPRGSVKHSQGLVLFSSRGGANNALLS